MTRIRPHEILSVMADDRTDAPPGPPAAGAPARSGNSPFPSTRWSVVRRAADAGDEPSRAALETLLKQYWRPVHSYVRAGRWAPTAEEAEDLVQEFFAVMLEKRTLARADPARGCFRGFLKASLRHFLLHDYERRKALKRGGGAPPPRDLPDDLADPKAMPAEDGAFDREWARQILRDAVADLERDLLAESKGAYFRVLELRDLGDDAPSYADIASMLGLSESDVRNYLHVARARLRRLVRLRVQDSVDDEASLEDEIRALFG